MSTRLLLLLIALLPSFAHAIDVTGSWKAEFDSPIGKQKYTYVFRQDGSTVNGKATAEIAGEKRPDAELQSGKLDGDKLAFVEMVNFQGTEIRVTYEGVVTDGEIKFKRVVGEYATEEFIARREPTVAQPASPSRSGN